MEKQQHHAAKGQLVALCWLLGTSVLKKQLESDLLVHSVCRSEAAQVESESMYLFHTLGWYLLSSQRRSLCSLFSSFSGIE
jgi:hypothetical protein